jgi:phosphatidylserine/phosphatidylglycerophosphate/cardiolipin synthase-like enzyme
MFKLAVRFTKSLAILLLIVLVAAGVGVAYYVIRGGDLHDLKRQTERRLDQSKGVADPNALSKEARALREKLEPLREKLGTLYGQAGPLQDRISAFLARESGTPGAAKENKAAGSASQGEIRVYFAPCQPADPFGIDDAFLGFLNSAKRSIHGAFFELELPAAAKVLIAKHEDGVDVRFVSDRDYSHREAVRSCMASGIPVVFDDRAAFMHDKFCVVDGTLVWTGSTNITENCMYRNNNNSLLVSSPQIASDFESEFDEMFSLHKFGKKSPQNTPYPEVAVGDARVDCYFAPEDHVQEAIIGEIGTAQSEIDVLAFSFTSREIAEAIASRIEKGVKVRAVFDERQAGSEHSQDEYLSKRGAFVRLDRSAYTMHDKVIIIDAKTVITGSYNFTKSADTQNDENLLIVHSPDLAAEYEQEFESICQCPPGGAARISAFLPEGQ